VSEAKKFFSGSCDIQSLVLQPLSHIYTCWDISWDINEGKFEEKTRSLGSYLNNLIEHIDSIQAPENYHEYEDQVAEFLTAKDNGWGIKKVGRLWVGAHYHSILEQGGFGDFNQEKLIMSVAGRIKAARSFGQVTFDEMEEGHKNILAFLLANILYHRC